MDKQQIILSGILESYVLGIATAEEIAEVDRYVKEFPELKTEIINIKKALINYYAIQPSEKVKQNVFTNIIDGTETIRNKKVIKISYAAAAAILGFIILSTMSSVLYFNKYKTENRKLVIAQEQILKQQENLNAFRSNIDIVTNKYSQTVNLTGTENSPLSFAKIFWIKNTGDVYIDASLLPHLPAEKQYQLWAIVDGKPVDAGLIETPKSKYFIQKMKTFGNAQAFAITIERKGGSESPTISQMVVTSSL